MNPEFYPDFYRNQPLYASFKEPQPISLTRQEGNTAGAYEASPFRTISPEFGLDQLALDDDCCQFHESCSEQPCTLGSPKSGTNVDSGDYSFQASEDDPDIDHFLLDASMNTDRQKVGMQGSPPLSTLDSTCLDSHYQKECWAGQASDDLAADDDKSEFTDSRPTKGFAQRTSHESTFTFASEDLEQTSEDKLPLISREGLRKTWRNKSSALAHKDRMRKNRKQVAYLTRLYQLSSGGKLDRRQRKQAMKETGLSWIQIYKWLFDQQLKDNQKCLSVGRVPAQIFRVIGPDGQEIGKPAPLFKVERISRAK